MYEMLFVVINNICGKLIFKFICECIMELTMVTHDIYSVLKSGSTDMIKSLINAAPESSYKDFVLSMADTNNLAHIIIALNSMVMEYCFGKNPEYGAKLAEATHKIALEIYTEYPDKGGLVDTTLSNLATQHLNALNHLGRSDEVIDAADIYIPRYKDLNEMENYPSLVVAKANALLNLNRIDECKILLEDLDCSQNPGAHIEKNRLLNRINILTGSVTSIEAEKDDHTVRKSILDAFSNTDTSVLGDNQLLFEQLKTALGDTNKHPSLDPNDINDYKKLLDLIDSGESMLTRGGTDDTELTMKKKCREASSIFHPAAVNPPTDDQIKHSLAGLREVYTWARTNNSKELLHDSVWGRYLCNSSLNYDSQAADALIELRTMLEEQRAGITDPVKRGGAFSTYPQLFNATCEKLQKSGRYFELLEAIEASKGRAIADILTRKHNKPVPDADIYGAVKKLETLTKSYNFNFLSCYLDRYAGDAIIYMVMMCKDGNTYGIDPVHLDEGLFDNAIANIDPRNWGMPGYRGRKKPDASMILAPLTSILTKLSNEGVLKKGDHICYTGDDQLNNLPLHYLPFNDGMLIDYFSFSKIHNAAQLEHLLESTPASIDHAEVFVVPAIQDINGKNWPGYEKSINQPSECLEKYLKTKTLKDLSVSFKTLQQHNLQHGVLHFSTHGVFDIKNRNPYDGSGLVISDGNSLPDKDIVAGGDFSCVLTPRVLVESDLNITDSHISLMACVSGLSREGQGGDALGLDWALVNAGARSILSSHWYISAQLSAQLFERFYHYWLGERQSRAKAFQSSIKELKRNSSLESMHQWTAFSLSGDWR